MVRAMADELPTVELTETSGEWRLRINCTQEMIDKFVSGDASDVDVTVVIRPNLVPGGPFTAQATLVR